MFDSPSPKPAALDIGDDLTAEKLGAAQSRELLALSTAIESLDTRLGRPASREELADELGASPGELQQRLAGVRSAAKAALTEIGREFLAERGGKPEQLVSALKTAVAGLTGSDLTVTGLIFEHKLTPDELAFVLGKPPLEAEELSATALIRLGAKLRESL